MSAAVWAIIGLILLIAGYVTGFDLWAAATGRVSISGQVHVWMGSQLAGPLVAGVWVGVSAGLLYHFLINK